MAIFRTLQKEVELLEKGELDDKLPEMWEEIQRCVRGGGEEGGGRCVSVCEGGRGGRVRVVCDGYVSIGSLQPKVTIQRERKVFNYNTYVCLELNCAC